MRIVELQPLLEYLSKSKPALQVDNFPCPGPNKEDRRYDWRDIKRVSSWEDFTYETMKQNYSEELGMDMFVCPFRSGVRTDIASKRQFEDHLNDVCNKVCLALKVLFDKGWNPSIRPFTPVTMINDMEATVLDGYKPDLVFIEASAKTGQIQRRCLGNVDVSWEWKSTWKTSTDESELTECKKGLAQLSFFMKQNNTRYGFIATDIELVAVKREVEDGHLSVADSIPWAGEGKFTYLMGMFYLGMLAAGDDWKLEGDNTPGQLVDRLKIRNHVTSIS